MKRVFAFTMFFITLIAALLFWETMRLQFFTEKKPNGTFAYISFENGGEI